MFSMIVKRGVLYWKRFELGLLNFVEGAKLTEVDWVDEERE
jgi:hypothetical protein